MRVENVDGIGIWCAGFSTRLAVAWGRTPFRNPTRRGSRCITAGRAISPSSSVAAEEDVATLPPCGRCLCFPLAADTLIADCAGFALGGLSWPPACSASRCSGVTGVGVAGPGLAADGGVTGINPWPAAAARTDRWPGMAGEKEIGDDVIPVLASMAGDRGIGTWSSCRRFDTAFHLMVG